jgi:ribosomal protein L32
MPNEPKKKHSKSVKRIRRASIKLGAIALQTCKNCNAKTMAHMACRECGYYGEKHAVTTKARVIRA